MEYIWFAVAALLLVVISITTIKCKQLLSARTHSIAVEDEMKLTRALQTHVYILSQEIGIRNVDNYDNLNEAANYIEKKFKEFGYTVEFQHYDAKDKNVKNIIAVKPGTINPEEIIVVGAHYDSYYNPGADDNASGVSALLELAKLTAGHCTNKSIEFVAFVNEEPPFFHTDKMGSRVYTKLAKKRGKNIKAGLILEMLGYYSDETNSQRYPQSLELLYPDKANFIAIVDNRASNLLATQVVTSFKTQTEFPIEQIASENVPEGDFSDHWSFWQESYPAVMVTDTSFYRYSHYHQQSDTYEKLHYKNMSEVVLGLHSVIMDLAK